MSSFSYLFATDRNRLCPRDDDDGEASEAIIVAEGVYRVPLLWFALFRPADLRTQEVEVDGETSEVTAPIVESAVALRQLAEAVEPLNAMFATQGDLREYVDMLHEAVASAGRKYLTIDMEEILCMGDAVQYLSNVRHALNAFAGQAPLPVGRASLIKMSEIDAQQAFPPSRCLIDGHPTPDEAMLHSGIIGAPGDRGSPWTDG